MLPELGQLALALVDVRPNKLASERKRNEVVEDVELVLEREREVLCLGVRGIDDGFLNLDRKSVV